MDIALRHTVRFVSLVVCYWEEKGIRLFNTTFFVHNFLKKASWRLYGMVDVYLLDGGTNGKGNIYFIIYVKERFTKRIYARL